MLTVVNVKLSKPIRANVNMSSLLHGWLMQHVDGEYAEYLHNQGLRPYTQQVFTDVADNNIWRLTTLNEQARTQIIEVLRRRLAMDGEIYLKQKNLTFVAEDFRIVKEISYQQLVTDNFTASLPARRVKLQFITPTTFKSAGGYMLYPQVPQIFQSLSQRWNTFSNRFSVEDREALEHLVHHTGIVGYKIHSYKFPLEGVSIPAFRGEISLNIRGPEALLRIACMLLNYGEFAGIGIKTALGMGRSYAEFSYGGENIHG